MVGAPDAVFGPYRSANPLASRAAHIDATLAAAGWLVEPGSDEDPLCDAARVAAELDISVTTARRWIADGTLPTVTVPDAQSVPRTAAAGCRTSGRTATISPGGSCSPTSPSSSAFATTRRTRCSDAWAWRSTRSAQVGSTS